MRRGRSGTWLRVAGAAVLLCVLSTGCAGESNGDLPIGYSPATLSIPTASTSAWPVRPTEYSISVPTEFPTAVPTKRPTAVPTKRPTAVPTKRPTVVPTQRPTATSSQEPASLKEERERLRSELANGLVAYDPPSSAVVDEEFELTVRVQRGSTPGSAFTELPGPTVVVSTLDVGTYMVADLGGASFDTTLIGPKQQPLIDAAVEWVWKVKPRAAGPHVLTLSLNAVDRDGRLVGEDRKFRRELTVNVAAAVERGWSQRVFGWGGWGEVLATLLAAAALGIWKKGAVVRRWVRLRTKHPSRPSAPPPPDPTSSQPDPASTHPDPAPTQAHSAAPAPAGAASAQPDPASTQPDPASVHPGRASAQSDPASIQPDPASVHPGPASYPGPASAQSGPAAM